MITAELAKYDGERNNIALREHWIIIMQNNVMVNKVTVLETGGLKTVSLSTTWNKSLDSCQR